MNKRENEILFLQLTANIISLGGNSYNQDCFNDAFDKATFSRDTGILIYVSKAG